jgi:DNA invertase Pin-like site-specific DNA recombinase
MVQIGYARVSTLDHEMALQIFRDDECRVRKDDFSEKLDS